MDSTRVPSLRLLRATDAEVVALASDGLKKHGFVFLDLDKDELQGWAIPVVDAAATFLEASRGTGSTDALTGHISSKYKDSLRLLSGNQYKDTVPVNGLETLVKVLDKAAVDIVKSLAGPLFGCSDVDEVGQKFDLPLLQQKCTESYGLVDVVRYRNEEGTPDVVVSEHKDPGLLILALPELGAGLELLGASGQWVTPPKGFGVLWAGAAAAGAGVKPGIHRVRTMVGAPRVNCWHEICTSAQIAPPMLKKLEENDMELQMGSVKGTKQVLETLRMAEDHDTQATKFLHITPVSNADTPQGGLPISKVETATVKMPVKLDRDVVHRGIDELDDFRKGIPISKVARTSRRRRRKKGDEQERSFERLHGLRSGMPISKTMQFSVRKEEK